MNIFYKPTYKVVLEARNKVFQEKGIPALLKNGFSKSPYKSSWYGKDNQGGYDYLHCKLIGKSRILHLRTYIINKDIWIQNYLNIFDIKPEINLLSQLLDIDCINYFMPPCNLTSMRLKINGYKVMPLLRDMFVKQHKLGSYYTKSGFENRLIELGNVLEEDLNNIYHFVKMWQELHKPLITNWDGILMSDI